MYAISPMGKKVIPATCSIGNWRITDIKLPDLLLTNNGETALDVEGAEMLGFVSGTEAVRLRISGGELREAIRNTAGWIGDPNTPLPVLQLSFGDVALPEGALAEGTIVGAGKSVVLPALENLLSASCGPVVARRHGNPVDHEHGTRTEGDSRLSGAACFPPFQGRLRLPSERRSAHSVHPP